MQGEFIHFVSAWLIRTDERRVLIRCNFNVVGENVLMAVNSLVVFQMVTSDPWVTAVMSHAAAAAAEDLKLTNARTLTSCDAFKVWKLY